MGTALKTAIREYMRNHPGIKYTEARRAVLDTHYLPDIAQLDPGVSLLDALGDTSPTAVAARWETTEFSDNLRIPIGFDIEDRSLIELDLGEYTVGGNGPHGYIQGMCGTGKTVLLWNTLLALAANNSPTKLNIALAEFKGNWVSNNIKALPHLTDSSSMMEESAEERTRFVTFVNDELYRRMDLLQANGMRDIREYTAHRADDGGVEPLPHLIVVVDSFREYTPVESTDIHNVITRVAKIGRSLGVHLLLCDHYMNGSRLAEVLHAISYRVTLRVSSRTQSESAIGVADAADLPIGKGDALLWHLGNGDSPQLTRLRTLQLEPDHYGKRAELVARIVAAQTAYQH